MLRLAHNQLYHNRPYAECITATELKAISVAVLRDTLIIGSILFIVSVILS